VVSMTMNTSMSASMSASNSTGDILSDSNCTSVLLATSPLHIVMLLIVLLYSVVSYTLVTSILTKMPPRSVKKEPANYDNPPAGEAPTEKREASTQIAAASSAERKKRGKTRKEAYSNHTIVRSLLIHRSLSIYLSGFFFFLPPHSSAY
jgi:hypothetical protein